jgi:autotransporter-associated beta strand protein
VVGDLLSVNRTAAFVDKNVGTVNINVTGVSLDGGDAANYQVVDANGAATTVGSTSANITPKLLTAALVGSIQKTYDGNTSATLTSGNFSLNGFVTVNGVAEGASVTQTVGVYNDRNVLSANSVSTTLASGDFTANSGTSFANYTLPTSATGAGSIGVRALSVSFAGVSRAYDGSTVATVTPSYTPLGSDVVEIVRSASFDSKNVDTNKTISVYNVSLSGADASNYGVNSTGSTSADVTRQSSVTWVGGSTGEWFNPVNWAMTSNPAVTGVVPDKYNVSAVIVPQGSSLSFDENARSGLAEAGAVTLSHLTYQGAASSGGLNLKAGSLTLTTAGVVGALESTAGTTLRFAGSLSVDVATGLTKTVAGDLSGAGSLTKAGAGTLVLSGVNAYTGSTTIEAGNLQLGNGGTTGGLLTSGVVNNGTLTFNIGADNTVPYNISGSGHVVVLGAKTNLFNGFLTTSAQTMATNTTVAEVLARLSGAQQSGAAVTYDTQAGIYFKRFDPATNTATFQVQFYYDNNLPGDYTKVVFVKLQQSGSNVQALAYQGRTGAYAVYTDNNVLGTDFTTTQHANTMSLAVVTGGAGYGVNALYSSARVNFTGVNSYSGTTTLSNTVANIANTQALGTSYAYQSAVGALQVGNGATVGTVGAGDVTNNGVFMMNRSNTWVLSNNLSGTGLVM